MDDAQAKSELSHEFLRYTRVFHLMKAQLAGALPAGIDPAAAQLLSWLVRQGPSRQGELAEHTFLDPSTISRRVSQLVQQGLVERRADPGDGRAVQLVPTGPGRDCVAAMWARREEMMREVLAGWPGEDVAVLVRLMRKFNDDFEAHRHRSGAAGAPEPARPEETHVHR